MTERQIKIYHAIIQHTKEHGYTPTIKELCDSVGIPSKNTVFFALRELQNLGYVELAEHKKSRCIKVIGYAFERTKELKDCTLLEDFLNKYPKAILREEDGTPNLICPYMLGYEKDARCTYQESCLHCWTRKISEVSNV